MEVVENPEQSRHKFLNIKKMKKAFKMELLNSEQMENSKGGLGTITTNLTIGSTPTPGTVLACTLASNVKACVNFEASCTAGTFAVINCGGTEFHTLNCKRDVNFFVKQV